MGSTPRRCPDPEVRRLFARPRSPAAAAPDFVPILGYADDAIVVALVLRSVTRRAGFQAPDGYWPGSAEALSASRRVARLTA